MNGKNRSDREERLRAVLRQGDPAGAEPGPAPEEVRRMRRTILSAVVEPRRRGFWLPVVASAAAAALTLALALGLWRAYTDSAVRPPETGRRAVAVPEPSLPEEVIAPPAAVPAPQADHPLAEAPRRPRPPHPAPEPERLAAVPEVNPEAPSISDAEPDSPLPIEEPPMRQVQLEAPGGTRVIWMLSTESVVDESAD